MNGWGREWQAGGSGCCVVSIPIPKPVVCIWTVRDLGTTVVI
jgi:hypothetical protein